MIWFNMGEDLKVHPAKFDRKMPPAFAKHPVKAKCHAEEGEEHSSGKRLEIEG
jgi:hypothetical protein